MKDRIHVMFINENFRSPRFLMCSFLRCRMVEAARFLSKGYRHRLALNVMKARFKAFGF
jgi:hypothetical protein